jgi:hypothetical protein
VLILGADPWWAVSFWTKNLIDVLFWSFPKRMYYL